MCTVNIFTLILSFAVTDVNSEIGSYEKIDQQTR